MPARLRCAICRKAALPGARLCGPCRAALKRARDTTVSEAWIAGRGPRGTRPLRPRPEPAGRPVRDATAAVQTGPAPAIAASPASGTAAGARRPWAIAAALVGSLAVAAIAVVHLRPEPGAAAAPRYAVTEGAQATEPIQASKLLPASLPAAAVARPVTTETPPAPWPAEVDVPSQSLDGRAKARPPVRVAPPPAESPPVPEVAPPPPVAVVADLAPPPAVVALAAAAPARPPPDRWQRLADALARCPDDFVARAVCQQSLRLEHCEGAWGRVAVCPPRVERDYGN